MRLSIKTNVALAALLLSLSVSALGGERADLARLLETFLEGASENDAAVHERFWAEDLIYTGSDGRRFGKEEIMASLSEAESADEPTSTAPAPHEYSGRDITIRIFGDTAIVTFRLVAQQGGEPVGEYLNTGVFRRRQPGWKAITWQATRAHSSSSQP